MMKIVYCEKCNSPSTKSCFAHIKLSASNWCKSCRHSHHRDKCYFFCSPECMVGYLQEHKEEFLKEANDFALEGKKDK